LFEWTVILHNLVNKELGKPVMKFEDAFNHYDAMLSMKVHPTTNNKAVSNEYMIYILILCLIIISMLIYIFMNQIKKS
jgi:hypothetical protein